MTDAERERLQLQVIARARLPLVEKRAEYENNFGLFVEAAWPSIDPAPFMGGWVVEAVAEHLQAVSDGKIKRLLINQPPRTAKTLLSSVMFPAWVWARGERDYLSGPQVRFLCASYGHTLALMNSNNTRRLILSPFYQKYWSKRFALKDDMNTKAQYDNSEGGSRLSTSVGGSLLGLGGDALIVDDPINTEDVASDAELATTTAWWKELSSTRLNDPKQAAIIVCMQRLDERDLTGEILSNSTERWEHLCIPAEYEWRRHCVTAIGWEDPRGLDDAGEPLVLVENGQRFSRDRAAEVILENEREGSLMWPERFGAADIARIKDGLGPHMAASRLQQAPQPKSGGILKRDWFQLWAPQDNKFPLCDVVVASVDTAFSTKQEADPSACTVWGVFKHPEIGQTRVILIDAWQKHLQMHGDAPPRLAAEQAQLGDGREIVRIKDDWYRRRVGHLWGLVEWIAYTCRRWGVSRVLIENAASGITAAQELQRLHGNEDWIVTLVKPKGDKVARALAVQPLLAKQLVYAPDKDFAEKCITQCSLFPHGRDDHLVEFDNADVVVVACDRPAAA